MPRPDRGMAQRYTAKKRKKRPSAGRAPVARVDALNAGRPHAPLQEDTGLPTRTAPSIAPAVARSAPPRPRSTSRRPFSAYADEYRYVLTDLRRVALVAGSLLVVLVVLSFFVR